jgi:polyisoprenoid-binding protein YceI
LTASLPRRSLLLAGTAAGLLPGRRAGATELLHIGSPRGTIDFALGDSWILRTAGSFKQWHGALRFDELDVPRSSVDVVVLTQSVQMRDENQTAMLQGADFFDVENFPQMAFHSLAVESTGEETLRVIGILTLRGIRRPMILDVSVTDQQRAAPPGASYARFRANGSVLRSEFGMTKFIDATGDTVEISIRADAWR